MRRQLRRFVVPSVLLGLACLPVGAAQSPDLAVNHWTRAAEMVTARAAACSALLPDGRLLLAGGEDQAGASRSAELLGANGVFASIAPMSIARAGAACVALQDGRVLVSGGSDGISALRSIEIYDPAKNTWTSAGAMSVPRSGHAATLLPWGSVLLVGGDESGMVEAFNPIRGDVQVGS